MRQVKNELLPYKNGIFQNCKFLSSFACWFLWRRFCNNCCCIDRFSKTHTNLLESHGQRTNTIADFWFGKSGFYTEKSAIETRAILFAKIHTFSDEFPGLRNNQIIWLKSYKKANVSDVRFFYSFSFYFWSGYRIRNRVRRITRGWTAKAIQVRTFWFVIGRIRKGSLRTGFRFGSVCFSYRLKIKRTAHYHRFISRQPHHCYRIGAYDLAPVQTKYFLFGVTYS